MGPDDDERDRFADPEPAYRVAGLTADDGRIEQEEEEPRAGERELQDRQADGEDDEQR